MLNLMRVKERFKSNAPIKRALPQRNVLIFNSVKNWSAKKIGTILQKY